MLKARAEEKSFILLLVLVSIAFIWLLLPFYSAVFWGTILAIIFQPVQRWMQSKFNGRRGWSAFVTLIIILLMVILPVTFLTGALVQEGAALYERMESGNINFGDYFEQIMMALPGPVHDLLARFGMTDFTSVQQQLSEGAEQASQFIATKAFGVGQDTFRFLVSFAIMLYLLFFLLRDGQTVSRHIKRAIPLGETYKQHLLTKFTMVVKATVKGNIAVAAVQGALGGFIFWALGLQGALLWGVLMAVLSLLPAVGAVIIWGPVAIYFLATGAIWQAVVLTAFGAVVIGLADNILRPQLVGKDLKLPDYVVLISTLGGLSLFGLNGFVIGPMIAALFIAAWSLFADAREDGDAEIPLAEAPSTPAASVQIDTLPIASAADPGQ